MLPNPIAQRFHQLFNAGGLLPHHFPPAPAGGGAEQVATGLDPGRRAEQLAASLDPARRAEQAAGGLPVGGGLRAQLAEAFSAAHRGLGDAMHEAAGHGHHGHQGFDPAHLAEGMAAELNPANRVEQFAGGLGGSPAGGMPPQGIHYFGPGGSGIAYPQEGGPVGSRGLSYSSPIRRRSALAQAIAGLGLGGGASSGTAVHPSVAS